VACNFQTGKNKLKLLTEYKVVTQKVLFGNAILAALMSERKYDAIPQNGNCSRKSQCAYICLWKQSPLSKRNVVTELLCS
jgi:hypothetical protein